MMLKDANISSYTEALKARYGKLLDQVVYHRMVKVSAILAARLCWAFSRCLATVTTMAFIAASSFSATWQESNDIPCLQRAEWIQCQVYLVCGKVYHSFNTL